MTEAVDPLGDAPQALRIDPIPAKFDRLYAVRARNGDDTYQVNVARLECTCPEFRECRSGFASDDARRVCEHLYDKLCSTKVERSFSLVVQLFIRYGRNMLKVKVVEGEWGALVLGRPFGPLTARAIGEVGGRPVLATYDAARGGWGNRDGEVPAEHADAIFERMRAAFPSVFR